MPIAAGTGVPTEEIAKRAAQLADLVRSEGECSEIRQHAHKLAAMAAQFDAPRIAWVADRIEQACAARTSPRDCLADLEVALGETIGVLAEGSGSRTH